jgi:DNA-binding LytR/AlgR family response regulator
MEKPKIQPVMVVSGNECHYIDPYTLVLLSREDQRTLVYYVSLRSLRVVELSCATDLARLVGGLPGYFFGVNRSQVVNLHYAQAMDQTMHLDMKCGGLPPVRVSRRNLTDFNSAMRESYADVETELACAVMVQAVLGNARPRP